MESLLGPSIRYTTKHPRVHDYNPLTHLSHARNGSEVVGSADFRTSHSTFSTLAKPSAGFYESSPVKRLAKSLPRSLFVDPVTGRKVDYSAPRSTFASSAVLSLSSQPANYSPQQLDVGQRYARTRLRTEFYDPITGNRATFEPVREQIDSLDTRPRIDNPQRIKGPIAAPVLSNTVEETPEQSIAGSRRRKAESLAYVNPFQI